MQDINTNDVSDTSQKTSQYEVSAFYQFAPLPNYQEVKEPIEALCALHHITGIILLADEGINGTIAGCPDVMAHICAQIGVITGLKHIEHKISHAHKKPFLRMKVRLKKEIVTIGDKSVDPLARVGTYVEAQDWNALISDPDVIVIDTRNDFEVSIGAFKGAVDPKTRSFSEFPDYVRKTLDPQKHKKVAMYCTGGIRCEKATSFMLQAGFGDVYHLKGGILKYLEEVPQTQSLWEGSCFVFDRRVGVEHNLVTSELVACRGCRAPLTVEDLQSPLQEEGVCCVHCSRIFSESRKETARVRYRQVQLAAKRGEQHIGPDTRSAMRKKMQERG